MPASAARCSTSLRILSLERVQPTLQRVRILLSWARIHAPCRFPAQAASVPRAGPPHSGAAGRRRSREPDAEPSYPARRGSVALRNRLRHLMKMRQPLVGGGICLCVAGATAVNSSPMTAGGFGHRASACRKPTSSSMGEVADHRVIGGRRCFDQLCVATDVVEVVPVRYGNLF